MNNPELLFNEKYPLSKKDFQPVDLHYVIYRSIAKLASNGAGVITEIEIDNLVKNKPVEYEILQDSDWMGFVSTMKELANPENYELYYNTIRKFSLLRDMKENGEDIKRYYDELSSEEGQIENLNKFTIQDILDEVEIKANSYRNKYDATFTRAEMWAGEGFEGVLEGFKEAPAFGAIMPSPYLTTLYQGWCRGHLLMRSAPSGMGKAIPNYTIIPTPSGEKRVDEIKIGDSLYSRIGKPTKVLGVFPQGCKQVYQVVFKDGRVAECCDEHLWSYYYGHKTKRLTTKTLKEIMGVPLKTGLENMIRVPINEGVEKPEKKYFIPPYIFGLFLGDGSFRRREDNGTFYYSSPNDELVKVIAETMSWDYKKSSKHNYNWTFKTKGAQKTLYVDDILEEFPDLINAYSGDKYIPNDYLNGSLEQRFDLLNGLLDTDGSAGQKGRVNFTTTSEKMAQDMIDLCRSLGFIPTVFKDKRTDKYSSGNCFTITIKGSPELKAKLFKYSPKKEKMNEYLHTKMRRESNDNNPIIEIIETNKCTEMTCFLVDNEEHLFLMNDYIVTHNTKAAIGDLCYASAQEMWSDEYEDFVVNPNYQGGGFYIHTEQKQDTEIQPNFIACIANVPYHKIRMHDLTHAEELRVKKAGQILLDSKIRLIDMPDFTISKLDKKVKECAISYGLPYGVFDYIWDNNAAGAELKSHTGVGQRQDMLFLSIASQLKMMAETYNTGIYTMTQLNGNEKTNEIIDEACVFGSKAMKTKIDAGSIMLRPRNKEYKKAEPYMKAKGFGPQIKPNVIDHVYKTRYGTLDKENLKIWAHFDKGTCRRTDLFVTDSFTDEYIKVPKPDFNGGF